MAELSLLGFGVALGSIAVAGGLAARVGFSVIPAYILVGVVVGPNPPTTLGAVPFVPPEFADVSLTLVEGGATIDLLAELGVVFLLFFLGLEFSLDKLLADRRRIAGIGLVDLTVNLGAGLVLGVLAGWTLVETLFLAGVVYISSSAIVTKSLIDRGWVANAESDPILGTLVFEDVFIAVYLAVLAAIASGTGPADAVVSILQAFAFLGTLLVLAWYGTGLLERLFTAESDELFLLRALAATTLVAGLALEMGVSEAVAAFFVGTAVGQTGHVPRMEGIVAPARDFFAAVFFFAIGLTIDVTLLAEVSVLLGAAVVLTTLTKLASGTLSGRAYGLGRVRSLRVGIGLVPRGEFSLVVATLAAGVGTGRLGTVVPTFAVGYVLLMSVLGTVLIQYADVLTGLVSEPA